MHSAHLHTAAIALSLCLSAAADIVVPGANGADGAFNPTAASTVVDLSLAKPVSFADFEAGINPPGFVPGDGVYIPEQWAVVFRYNSVDIPSNVTVTFKNHPSRAPVIWLVSGNATITGAVRLDGTAGHAGGTLGASFAEPGPGGFRGGRGVQPGAFGSGGLGPGGGGYGVANNTGGGGGYGALGGGPVAVAGLSYGNGAILPLMGGSGGSVYRRIDPSSADGGGGGGAILIAASSTVTVAGTISANGGSNGGGVAGGGSGGAVRIVTDAIAGAGTLVATGGAGYDTSSGSVGRLPLEANTGSFTGSSVPVISSAGAGATAQIWPEAASPSVRVVSVADTPVPADPRAGFEFPLPDLIIETSQPIVLIEAQNVPLSWSMDVRIVPASGPTQVVTAAYTSGTTDLSTWMATIPTLSNGTSAIQVRAFQPE